MMFPRDDVKCANHQSLKRMESLKERSYSINNKLDFAPRPTLNKFQNYAKWVVAWDPTLIMLIIYNHSQVLNQYFQYQNVWTL